MLTKKRYPLCFLGISIFTLYKFVLEREGVKAFTDLMEGLFVGLLQGLSCQYSGENRIEHPKSSGLTR